MSEKSLGQIAHEKWMSRHPGACKPWSDLNVFTQGDYEVMAQAVAQKVREESRNAAAHLCAVCGDENRTWYNGPDEPVVHPGNEPGILKLRVGHDANDN